MESVILVDTHDNEIGSEEKIAAHKKALLHRAFSVYIFNSKGELLLQRRALDKYHCPGIWANTACSHPRHGEPNEAAAARRLKEEMGMECPLKEAFQFIYKVEFDNGLTEHEFLHVFIGQSDKNPTVNKDEVHEYKWMSWHDLKIDIGKNPTHYTEWTKMTLDLMEKKGILQEYVK